MGGCLSPPDRFVHRGTIDTLRGSALLTNRPGPKARERNHRSTSKSAPLAGLSFADSSGGQYKVHSLNHTTEEVLGALNDTLNTFGIHESVQHLVEQ